MAYHFISSKKSNTHTRLTDNNLSAAQSLNKDETINLESPQKESKKIRGVPEQQMTPTTNQQMELQSPVGEQDPMASPAPKKSIRKRVKNV